MMWKIASALSSNSNSCFLRVSVSLCEIETLVLSQCWRLQNLLNKLTIFRPNTDDFLNEDPPWLKRSEFWHFFVRFWKTRVIKISQFWQTQKGTLSENSLENFSSKTVSDRVINRFWPHHLRLFTKWKSQDETINSPFSSSQLTFSRFSRFFLLISSLPLSLDWKFGERYFCQ